MHFDRKKRRYVDEHGNVMSAAAVRREVDDYVENQKEDVQGQARKLLAGTITLSAFFAYMRNKIEKGHKVSGSIAYGGQAQMNDTRDARIAARIESELEYLKNFKDEVSVSFAAARAAALSIAESEIAGQIEARAGMYMDALFSTYENNVAAREVDNGVTLARRICENDPASCDECVEAATEEYIPLDEVSDIGSLTCLNNCRCYYEFSFNGVEPLRIDATIDPIFNRTEAVQ